MRWYDDPIIATRIHTGGVLAWTALVPIALKLGWLESVTFVSALSIAALAIGHWSAREASTAQRDLETRLDRIEESLNRLLH